MKNPFRSSKKSRSPSPAPAAAAAATAVAKPAATVAPTKPAKKIAIVYYSTWGHIRTMALAQKKGIERAGYKADLYQITETLPQDVLDKMYAPPKPEDPIATPETLVEYDGFLLGTPTRFGNQPAQWRSFWDASGALWAAGKLAGKFVGVFTSTGSPNSGVEATVVNSMSTFTHHGLVYVPLGYSKTFPQITNLDEVHGASPWGAGTFAGGDGSRQPSELELEVASIQGEEFAKFVNRD